MVHALRPRPAPGRSRPGRLRPWLRSRRRGGDLKRAAGSRAWVGLSRVAPLLCLVAVVGQAGALGLEIVKVAGRGREVPIDARYSRLLDALPEDPELGYLSDVAIEAEGGLRRYLRAQYAVAPHVLAETSAPRVVLADLSRPERLQELCEVHGLEPLEVFAGGLALLTHRRSR